MSLIKLSLSSVKSPLPEKHIKLFAFRRTGMSFFVSVRVHYGESLCTLASRERGPRQLKRIITDMMYAEKIITQTR